MSTLISAVFSVQCLAGWLGGHVSTSHVLGSTPCGSEFQIVLKKKSLAGSLVGMGEPTMYGVGCGLGLKARVKARTIGGGILMYEGGSFRDFLWRALVELFLM
jgi:hypothetical protein